MNKWFSAIALLAVLFVAVSCAADEPTAVPATEMPVATEEVAVEPQPTVAEAEVVGESGLTDTEVAEMAAEGLTEEELALWETAYTLPDGTIVVPAAPNIEGETSVSVMSGLTANGDLDGDGTTEQAVMLVDSSDPDSPQLYVAIVVDQDGQLVNTGTVALPAGFGASALAFEDGKVVLLAPAAEAEAAWQQFVYAWANGQLEQSGDASQLPAPTAAPTDSPQLPAPPYVDITLDPPSKYAVAGEKVDIYVNAKESAGIVKLEWYLDNVKQEEKVAPEGQSAPYTHQTFVWRQATVGEHYIFVTATDIYGQVGTSRIVKYIVPDPAQ